MYKRFEPSELVFVDREEYLEWMDEALKRCKDKPVVLHLRGIGGIGKSSLLDYWTNTIDSTIRLDCQQYSEFYSRLNILAKGVVLHGVRLTRFDVLWQIRQRFVEGVEPVREEGREWAKEVVMLVPFIGSLATIGSAIKAVGTKVTPKLRGKYSSLGKWLQESLGKNHVERLLEILWKDPRHAEFLFLSALVEDLNCRKNVEAHLVFLFDHFEYVDADSAHWRYSGRKITETELWGVFLSSLSNCVGVMASRRPVTEPPGFSLEESELTELDRESCIELLDLRNIADSELQERIVSVSGGNPFVIGTLCDMAESGSLSLASVESLRSETLEDVRLKTWRKLFKEVQDLQELANRAGLLPYFDRNVMNTIAPTMNTDQWTRMVNLSFVKDRGDGTYVMHDLARDLVVGELGDRFHILADEVAGLLETAAEGQEDMRLLGLSISVQGIHSSESALQSVLDVYNNLSWKGQFGSALELLNSVSFGSLREQMIVSSIKAQPLAALLRVAETEHLLKEAIDVLGELAEADPKSNRVYLGDCYRTYGYLLDRLGQPVEAQAMYEKALQIARETDPAIVWKNQGLFSVCWSYSILLAEMQRWKEAADILRWALDLMEQVTDPVTALRQWGLTMSFLGENLLMAGRIDEAEAVCRDVLETRTEPIIELNSLVALGVILRLTSKPNEAMHTFSRGLDLVQKFGDEGLSYLSVRARLQLLRRYALALKLTGNFTGAETFYKEALERSRESASESPEVYLPYLTHVLNDSAILHYETGRYSEARKLYKEALENYRQLSKDWPDRYEKHLAWTLNGFSMLLRETGESAKAQEFYHKALDIARVLTSKYPEYIFHSNLLGNVLNNLGVLHRKMNQNEKAEEALRQALEVREELARTEPDVFLSGLATSLNNLGVVLSNTNRLSEAQEVCLRALEIRRELVERSPEMHKGRLGFVLNNLGNAYRLSGEHSKAEKCYQEALGIFEDMAAEAPAVYHRYVPMILSNLILHHTKQGATDAAESINKKLGQLGSSGTSKQEVWIEEEETEADPLPRNL